MIQGYVYLIGTPTFRWYKIGKSETPEVRIQNLGILLPFKIKVIGVWAAHNHSLLEILLHERYNSFRINGEWFEFTKKEVDDLFTYLPHESKIYPSENNLHKVFSSFSNLEEDRRENNKIIGVRVQNLRGNFTDHERLLRRQAGIKRQQERKALKQGLSRPLKDK